MFIFYSKNKHKSCEEAMVHSKMSSGAWWMLAVKTLWSILLFLIRSSPFLLEQWVSVVLLFRRQKTLAFNTSSTILDHGIRTHVSSFPDLSKTQTHLKDRYSPTESLHRSFVRQFTYNCQMSPAATHDFCRLITSSTNGYDGISFRF